ncbi:glycoside hydrolase family 3 protein [Gelidibacter salicanalis]|uniref:Glycoside hydrolase family 3 C-terminal domain-containing protein n=1 Tax=Gelidibacter salicanalis TaxID=291193 RepID=A0A934NHB6_9FLAO|nr:glycoside hydrolase family 3 protein [Gelidibacter salicanalis]MBJ7880651.1 glycoside hydrolase family 3 C-terminal domain-containing protein [Gelidibacter salicanalis]
MIKSIYLLKRLPLKTAYLIASLIIFGVVVSCGSSVNDKEKKYEFAFQDTSLDFDKRAEDLVSQMTLSEKVSQMRYDAPAIKRLGIPEYNWWNECLHGVARAGKATVFPQGIGMGSTWNPELIFEMGTAVSDEARAKHHKFIKEDQRGIYQGLTFWTPNINIFRDPRWGRGQETYGEDPYLTSRIGVNYINGLQGNDGKYLKLVATAKHFAVHSGPEKSRHEDNYQTSNKDLYETYLPAFEAAVKEAKVHSVMCAYNRFRDEACCGSNLLLKKILRDDWGFEGYVVSDCWAINDFWEPNRHGLAETPAEAGALAVERGTDLNCGSVFDPNLKEAVLKEMIDESKLDIALKRLFTARFKLGMFDPEEDVSFSKISYDVVASKEHYALSEKIARESMVLLKNDNNTLPLSKNIKSIAVIGPNANSKQALLGNYHGTPLNYETPLKAIKDKLPNATVNYALGSDIAEGWPILNAIPTEFLKNGKANGLKGEYYNNQDLKGTPVLTRNDAMIDFIWTPERPISELQKDVFSVRWTGQLVPKTSGTYRVGLKASSSGKLIVDGTELFKFSDDHEPKTFYSDLTLEKGKSYNIQIEYHNYHTDPQAHFVWAKMNEDLLTPAIEAAKKSEVVVLCLGLSPEIEGEEMPVLLEGFDKGDRSDITLPKTQIRLMKEIVALGKPTIVVLMNGSALAVNWAGDNVPAILEAWYPGEFGGKAIADVLFGDYNPAGRLPVTFYKSVTDLPDFKDYNMENRTYKYFTGDPLFPFGHGLSYTSFAYTNLNIPDEVTINNDINVDVEVRNTGVVDGDEVVQLYVSHKGKENAATRTLVGFERIHLKAGEAKKVMFIISPKSYALISENGESLLEPGSLELSVGGKQPGFKGIADTATSGVITKIISLIN